MFLNRRWLYSFILLALLSAVLLPTGSIFGQEAGQPLPLLKPGLRAALVYANPAPEAKDTLDKANRQALDTGVDAVVLAFMWSELEPSPGIYDTTLLEKFLAITDLFTMTPYLVIRTIDTVKLNLPADLLDSSGNLANERHFDDPVIAARFEALLDKVVPLMAAHRGFFISVGNEIDGWLGSHPQEVTPFIHFMTAARTHIQTLAPGMGVGATIMFNGVRDRLPLVAGVIAASDAAAFTYYPLNNDFTVRDPSVLFDDFDAMIAAAGDKPVLLQEIGYPSGYLPTPSNGSSGEKQRQFVENLFKALSTRPQIRFFSYFLLGDLSNAECDNLTVYYGLSVPAFREYLCSLGLYTGSGDAKPGFAAFIDGLKQIRHPS